MSPHTLTIGTPSSVAALVVGSSPCRHPRIGFATTQPEQLYVVALASASLQCAGTNGRHSSDHNNIPARGACFSLGHPPAAGAPLKANAMVATHRGKEKAKAGKKEHHLWMKRDSAGSGQKALNLVRIVSKLPNEKEAIYGALDQWSAFEIEFPLVAMAKALGILRKRNQWLRIIQVTKWLLYKGQGMTMGTYDVLLLAFDMDGRVDEAETLWNTVLQTHTRSVSKQLFSRMISLYSHHRMPDKILEVFADMEELGVKPDEDTVRRVGRAFQDLGQEDKQKHLLQKYETKFRYLHFNGERVRVRNSKECEEIRFLVTDSNVETNRLNVTMK